MRRGGLVARLVLLTSTVAVLAVLLGGLFNLTLIRGAADTQARRQLGRQADLSAGVLDTLLDTLSTPRGQLTRSDVELAGLRLSDVARTNNIALFAVGSDGTVFDIVDGTVYSLPSVTAALPAPLRERLAGGLAVSQVTDVDGRRSFLEGRPLVQGLGSVLLVQPSSQVTELTRPLRQRTLIALVAGLLVAVLAGVLLARRLARPLTQAAHAAHQLATGDRSVRLSPRGPAEVAEVATSLNALAEALAASEGRQREFLLSISHELRTPLTGLRGFAEALADGVISVPEQTRDTGAIMLTEAARLERLVSDLLDLARLGADDFRVDLTTVDLVALMTGAGRVWERRCTREGVLFGLDLPTSDRVSVVTDATRVRQIVDGLAENALRVTPAGAPIVLGLHRQGGGAVIEVRDGGPGLAPEDIPLAFERSALYERYRGVRRVGTGVGLALVAGLSQRLGGHPHAGRAPEGGALFAVWLPCAPAAVGSGAGRSAAGAGAVGTVPPNGVTVAP